MHQNSMQKRYPKKRRKIDAKCWKMEPKIDAKSTEKGTENDAKTTPRKSVEKRSLKNLVLTWEREVRKR